MGQKDRRLLVKTSTAAFFSCSLINIHLAFSPFKGKKETKQLFL